MALICDTGPLYAAIDRKDNAHRSCAALLEEHEEALIVPAPVVVELEWLVASRLGDEVFDSFLESIEDGAIEIEALVEVDYARIRELTRRYADLHLGFVDAAVIAVAERLGEPKVATLDRKHFSVVKPRHVKFFRLLPTE